MAAFPTFNIPPYSTTPNLPLKESYSRYLIPVVNNTNAGAGEAVGRAMAKAGMVVSMGADLVATPGSGFTILGFQTLTDMIVLSNGQAVLAEHIYVTLANAQAAGFPGNTGDIQFPNHQSSSSEKTS